MLKFNQYEEISEGLHFLNEKEIVLGTGKKYGQICFVVGGAGSGKGYAITHFLQGNKFKTRDVDEWKKAFLKLAMLKNKYPQLKTLDLNNDDDVTTLHMWVKEKGIKEKTLDLLLSQAKLGRLPNLLFDITYKDKEDINVLLPALLGAGYEQSAIHLVWVLTNYGIAVKQNKDPKRGRVVRDDIMLDTHSGASNNMYAVLKNGTPSGIDGGVYIILGGAKHTVYYKDAEGKSLDGVSTNRTVIKDFKYLTLKTPGKSMTTDAGLRDQAYKWIVDNVPKNFGDGAYNNRGIFHDAEQARKKEVSEMVHTKDDGTILPTIYCDMDQVLCNFLKGTQEVLGASYADKEYWADPDTGDKKEELAKKAPNFFRELEWMPDGKKLYDFIRKYDLHILSAYPSWMRNGKKNKMQWLSRHTNIKDKKINLVQRREKQNYATDERGQPAILIDDHSKNIKEWQAAGGIGILHTSAITTISKLKKMGF